MTTPVPPVSTPAPRRRSWRAHIRGGRRWTFATVAIAVVTAIPVLFLAVNILTPNTEMWAHQWNTRLPGQLVATLVLLVGVAICSTVLGLRLAWLTSAYRFPGSRVLGWLLILPLAMPSYIYGFVAISSFGRTSTMMQWWRELFGRDAWYPRFESIYGAIFTFTLVLYPYVYLLARAALRDQTSGAYHAARMLGATRQEATRRIVLPMIRPAIAAAAAVVMMETLTDFGTVQYFGVDTVTVGVFRIWQGTYDRDTASQFAVLVLGFALLTIGFERIARRQARFSQSGGAGSRVPTERLTGRQAWVATGTCVGVLVVAFVGPVVELTRWTITELVSPRTIPQTAEFPKYLWNSTRLVVATVVVCLAAAVVLVNAQRFGNQRITRLSTRVTAVGYAVPGPVISMGVLLALIAFNDVLAVVGLSLPGAVKTGSVTILVLAYMIRFLAPAVGAVEAGLDQVPVEMTSSARTLGAGSLRTLSRIHLPLSRSALVAAAVLVGIDALKELPVALLLRPFGFDTLPVWAYSMAAESLFEQAALPSLSIVAVAIVPVVLLARQLDT